MEATLWELDPDAGAAQPALRLGHLRRRRLDPRAHPRHRGADRRARRASARPRISPASRRAEGRDRRHRPRLLGGGRPPHRRPARRSAGAGQEVRPASRRLCQRRRSGRRPEAGRAVRDLGRRLSRMPSRIRPNTAADLDNLRRKIDAGADRAITQFFFSPETFFRFRDAVAAAGIDAEIVPGILPGLQRRPDPQVRGDVRREHPRLDGPPVRGARRSAGRAPARRRDRRRRALRASSMRAASAHFHFYTLNRAELAYAICHLLGLRPREGHDDERRDAA